MKQLFKIKRRGISKRLFAFFYQNVVMWLKLDKSQVIQAELLAIKGEFKNIQKFGTNL